MRKLIWTLLLVAGSVLPAQATLITIDSTNCDNNCYGLSWTLAVDDLGSNQHVATLSVRDDTTDNTAPNSNLVISAVDFKVTSGSTGLSAFSLTGAPGGASIWNTQARALGSGGCNGATSGFLCSQSSTAASVQNAPLIWAWQFTTSDPLFEGLVGAHIGAKLTSLTTPGRLLSETYSVPEPATAGLLMIATVFVMFTMASRRRARAV
jgi:hypothetical protein